jgi:hypothetical protein
MKRHLIYEAIGMLLAIFGAFFLFAVLMPIVNPGMFKLKTGLDTVPLKYYFTSVPIPLLVLATAWFFNKKAQRLKAEGNKPSDSA